MKQEVKVLVILAILFGSVVTAVKIATAKTTINVKNNVEASNSTSNNSETTTDIIIETNGQRKEYHSTEPGEVTISSDDGTSIVTVNSNSSAKITPKVTSIVVNKDAADMNDKKDTSKETPKKEKNKTEDKTDNKNISFFEFVLSIPQKLFSAFFN